MNAKEIFIIVASMMMLFSTGGNAQEDWGSPIEVWQYPGGWLNSANPTFYPDNSLCFEDFPVEENSYKLYFKPMSEWQDPILIPSEYINSDTFHTISPFVSFDGNSIYFASTRPGGYGGLDIWVSEWDGVMWDEPTNLGPNINTNNNEFGPSLTLSEDEIYFSRVDGQYDGGDQIESGIIFYSHKINNEWSVAEPLPEPVNINNHAWEPSITADGQKLYFSARRPENPLYCFAYVSNRTGGLWSVPEALNSNVNHLMWCPWDSSYWGGAPSVSIDSSGTALLFTY
jgi:hypothetical protein